MKHATVTLFLIMATILIGQVSPKINTKFKTDVGFDRKMKLQAIKVPVDVYRSLDDKKWVKGLKKPQSKAMVLTSTLHKLPSSKHWKITPIKPYIQGLQIAFNGYFHKEAFIFKTPNELCTSCVDTYPIAAKVQFNVQRNKVYRFTMATSKKYSVGNKPKKVLVGLGDQVFVLATDKDQRAHLGFLFESKQAGPIVFALTGDINHPSDKRLEVHQIEIALVN
ncbi:MAG: hypothetical protein AAGB24_13035 [Bacteroidota bacterium]